MSTMKIGIIGCGLMGREFASAAARWCHLKGDITRPEIVAVCSRTVESMQWFRDHFPSINFCTQDYRELLTTVKILFLLCIFTAEKAVQEMKMTLLQML